MEGAKASPWRSSGVTQPARKHSQEIRDRDITDAQGWGTGVTSKGEEVFRVMTMSWNETVVRGG